MRFPQTFPAPLRRRALLALGLSLALAALALPAVALGSKQPIEFFGNAAGNPSTTLGGQFEDPGGIAVNDTGAGPADSGDVYVADPTNNRIERFGRDDGGTPGTSPAATADDTYFFISAWGADVVSPGGSGDVGDEAAAEYEICTVASECKAGVPAAGDGDIGQGAAKLDASALAIDPDTGNLYLADAANFRINVYDGAGAFLYSFGYDVIASGPDDAGTGYEVCRPADGDICKAGLPGSGPGQIGLGPADNFATAEGIAVNPADGDPDTGSVYLADTGNRRVDVYALDGSSPAQIGSAAVFAQDGFGTENYPQAVAVDSRGILYVDNRVVGPERGDADDEYILERYDTAGVDGPVGFLAPIGQGVNESQQLTVSATAGSFRLCFETACTPDLPFNVSGGAIKTALESLSTLPPESLAPVNGGPGAPFELSFRGPLGSRDVPQFTCVAGSSPLSGGAGCSVTTTTPGQPGLLFRGHRLAIDPDEDGDPNGGPETDVLYVETDGIVQQFGPANPPGLLSPPAAEDDRHNTVGVTSTNGFRGLAVEPSTGRLYATSLPGPLSDSGTGVYVLGQSGSAPTASLDSIDAETATAADLHATIDPNGPPLLHYHFEYSTDAGANWTSTPIVPLGVQEDPQAVDYTLSPPPIGLEPNTHYLVRLAAAKRFQPPITTAPLAFDTLAAPPLVETTGAPVRTTSTAQLGGRVTPLGTTTTYHFEYGTTESYGHSTSPMPAGSGQLTELIGEEVEGLSPDTTYHFRLIAEGFGPPVDGADMTLTTRASDAPLSHGDFPGPPGSDRAYEQVSIADSSGNPISTTLGYSSNGDRAVYGIAGGTPISSTGSLLSLYFAERPAGEHPSTGWQTRLVTPPRDQLVGQKWLEFIATDDLSTMLAYNTGALGTELQLWQLFAGAPAVERGAIAGAGYGLAANGSRAYAVVNGPGIDSAHPATGSSNAYEVSAGTPRLLNLLPGPADGVISPCGLEPSLALKFPGSHSLSLDGSRFYFQSRPAAPCSGASAPEPQLYLRQIDAEQTTLVSGPPLSGPACSAALIKSTPAAVFFATSTRLDSADLEPTKCAGVFNDVYRYDLANGALRCLTCIATGFATEVNGSGPDQIAVSDDGSRLYFSSMKRLLPGAPAGAVYRLGVQSGGLAYVGPTDGGFNVGNARQDFQLTPDGKALLFASNSASVNPLGATTDNAGTVQYYRYSDADRSLLCYTCPQDGSPPLAGLEPGALFSASHNVNGPNRHAISADGETLAFATPTPLLPADQNTPAPGIDPEVATDAYEWRDGRLLLVSDGLTNWPGGVTKPFVEGLTPSGNDLFFTAPAAYTPDAPDALIRLYDARIGGGIDLPAPQPPCDLETCQGTPQGAPEEPPPGTSDYRGPGNPPREGSKKCPKGKHRVKRKGKVRCAKNHQKRRRHHKRKHHRSHRRASR